MPKDSINSKTGNAKIVKVGQTASQRFGANEKVQVKGNSTSRDLSIK